MTRRSRRLWIVATVVALLGIATIINFMGDGITVTLRSLHGQP